MWWSRAREGAAASFNGAGLLTASPERLKDSRPHHSGTRLSVRPRLQIAFRLTFNASCPSPLNCQFIGNYLFIKPVTCASCTIEELPREPNCQLGLLALSIGLNYRRLSELRRLSQRFVAGHQPFVGCREEVASQPALRGRAGGSSIWTRTACTWIKLYVWLLNWTIGTCACMGIKMMLAIEIVVVDSIYPALRIIHWQILIGFHCCNSNKKAPKIGFYFYSR